MHWKAGLVLGVFGLNMGSGVAQNLVPNPSFEDTAFCESWHPVYLQAANWYNANLATPDIWDCDTLDPCGWRIMDPTDFGVQTKGYLYSFDGHRHAGAFQWYGYGGSTTRDYLLVELLDSLEAGMPYLVSLYVARPTGHKAAIDHIGVWFGADSQYHQVPDTLPLVPQVELRKAGGGYLRDSVWTSISDTLIASGGERWMIIGTFDGPDNVDGIIIPPGIPDDATYYYIDLVSVVRLSGEGIGPEAVINGRYWASGDALHWSGEQPLEEVVVCDAIGRVVMRAGDLAAGGSLRTDGLSQGMYVAVGRAGSSRVWVKFVKE